MGHVRGEITGSAPAAGGVTPDHQVREPGREADRAVFVLDKHGTPLQPTSPARARKLLVSGRAVVARHTPFVIRLKDRTADASEVDGVELGIDPGSKHTGLAVFTARDGERRGRFAVQLDHRGAAISKKLEQRSAYRRGRRTRNLRYRAPPLPQPHPAEGPGGGGDVPHRRSVLSRLGGSHVRQARRHSSKTRCPSPDTLTSSVSTPDRRDHS
ncbi:RRXRR domain-containing protein [Streptomyces sp. QTS52]